MRVKIRSITVFQGIAADPVESLTSAGTLATGARSRLNALGYEVQTTRLALPPVELWRQWPDCADSSLLETAERMDRALANCGIDYVSLGPLSCTGKNFDLLRQLPDVLAATRSIFSSAYLTSNSGGDSSDNELLTGALPQIAKTIKGIAQQTANGFGNLRFAAIANCKPGIPFFPAAYARKGSRSFALAMEAGGLALNACRNASSVSGAMRALQSEIERHAQSIEPVMDAIALETGARFEGIDWSLAPHPDESSSIGAALEALSGAPIGGWGTLTAVAALTRAIRRASVRRTGFCGVFLPVLEDAVLAARASTGAFDLPRLLLYSAVCGTGLDTIPLPGDVSSDAIAAVLADVGTLALVLDKPLTVRLMPVPGLKSGQQTRFDFPYLVNSGIMVLDGGTAKLMRDETLRF